MSNSVDLLPLLRSKCSIRNFTAVLVVVALAVYCLGVVGGGGGADDGRVIGFT